MPEISVIMPVYNAADTLQRAVETLLAQTFEDWELILVDDGSTDESAEHCHWFARADDRVKVLQHPHRSAASARNRGLEAATGRYIGFMDADDGLDPGFYALLYRLCCQENVPLSACGFIKLAEGAPFSSLSVLPVTQTLDAQQALRLMFLQAPFRYSVCNKLFHWSLFRQIRFPEGSIYEDKGTLYRLIHVAGAVAWCPALMYRYYMRPGSIMHRPFDPRDYDLFTVNDDLLSFLSEHYPHLKPLADASCAIEYLKLYQRAEMALPPTVEAMKRCQRFVREHAPTAALSPLADWKTKRALLQLAYWSKR